MVMDIKLFDSELFRKLDNNAKDSPRRRSNCNIHSGYDSVVQRLFITLYPDSYVRPHLHIQQEKWEFFLMISGKISFLLFSNDGVCSHRYELSANGDLKGLEIPPNVWHCAVPCDRDEPATFFEVKQGPYIVADDKDFASWSPTEGHEQVPEFLSALKKLQPGEKVEQYL